MTIRKEHNYKNLMVWQKAMNLATEVYQLSADFPSEEKFGLTSQIRRCAVSVPSNIAEGSGRSSDREFVQFLNYSLGSSFELETQLILAGKLGLVGAEKVNTLGEALNEMQRMLRGFIKTLKISEV